MFNKFALMLRIALLKSEIKYWVSYKPQHQAEAKVVFQEQQQRRKELATLETRLIIMRGAA